MIDRNTLADYLNHLLEIKIKDYCPNGLQVEGNNQIRHIVTGVTASLELIQQAIDLKADTLLVHHGIFWHNLSPTLTDWKYKRIKPLLENNVNLFSYHLPLDLHATLGNNAQLAQQLDISIKGTLQDNNGLPIVAYGELLHPMKGDEFKALLTERLNRVPLHIDSHKPIKNIAWCTGAGQDFIEIAAKNAMDAFLTGEASERTYHLAKEYDLHFFAAGHHATERYGVKALGVHLAEKFGIQHTFLDINNPI